MSDDPRDPQTSLVAAPIAGAPDGIDRRSGQGNRRRADPTALHPVLGPVGEFLGLLQLLGAGNDGIQEIIGRIAPVRAEAVAAYQRLLDRGQENYAERERLAQERAEIAAAQVEINDERKAHEEAKRGLAHETEIFASQKDGFAIRSENENAALKEREDSVKAAEAGLRAREGALAARLETIDDDERAAATARSDAEAILAAARAEAARLKEAGERLAAAAAAVAG